MAGRVDEIKRAPAGEWTGYKQPLPSPKTEAGWQFLFSFDLDVTLSEKAGGKEGDPTTITEWSKQLMPSGTYSSAFLPFKGRHWTPFSSSRDRRAHEVLSFSVPHELPHAEPESERFCVVTLHRHDGSIVQSGVWVPLAPAPSGWRTEGQELVLKDIVDRFKAQEHLAEALEGVDWSKCLFKSSPYYDPSPYSEREKKITEVTEATYKDVLQALWSRSSETSGEIALLPETKQIPARFAFVVLFEMPPSYAPPEKPTEGIAAAAAAPAPSAPVAPTEVLPDLALIQIGPHGEVIPVPLEGKEAYGGKDAASAIKKRLVSRLRALDKRFTEEVVQAGVLAYHTPLEKSGSELKFRTFEGENPNRLSFREDEDLSTTSWRFGLLRLTGEARQQEYRLERLRYRHSHTGYWASGKTLYLALAAPLDGKSKEADAIREILGQYSQKSVAAVLEEKREGSLLEDLRKSEQRFQEFKENRNVRNANLAKAGLLLRNISEGSEVPDPRENGGRDRQSGVLRPLFTLTESAESPNKGTLKVEVYGHLSSHHEYGVLSESTEGFCSFFSEHSCLLDGVRLKDLWLAFVHSKIAKMEQAGNEAGAEEWKKALEILNAPKDRDRLWNTRTPITEIMATLNVDDEAARPQADQPEGLTVDMRWYQLQSLQFMLDMEKMEHGFHDLFWLPVSDPDSGERQFFSPYYGAIAKNLKRKATGGFLCDEMGLGKTVSTLALILANPPPQDQPLALPNPAGQNPSPVNGEELVPSRATLVVCAVSIVGQWIDEALAKLDAPDLKIYQYHGPSRSRDIKKLADYDLVVTTYQTLSSDFNAVNRANGSAAKGKAHPLGCIRWHRIVLDEAHNIKAPGTAQTRACTALESERRWCVTGTPMGTSIDDLMGMLQFLRITPFSDTKFYEQQVRGPKKSYSTATMLPLLLNKIVMRHSKKVIELPPKSVELVPVHLTQRERDKYMDIYKDAKAQYDVIRAMGEAKVNSNMLGIMSLLNPLRRICSGGQLMNADLRIPNLEERRRRAEAAAARGPIQLAPAVPGQVVVVPEDLDECSICLGELEFPVRTPCNHFFCRDCVVGFLERGGARGCPLCRQAVAVRQLCACKTQREVDAEEEARKAEQEREERRAREAAQGVKKEEEAEVAVEEDKVEPAPLAVLEATSKLKVLIRELRAMRASDPTAKALVFTQYTSTLEWLKGALQREGFGHRFISGSMPLNQRTQAIEAFQGDPPTTVFLLTIRSGAVGINLTAASHVFLLEPALNPALEEQAVGRAWRMGQQREVVVKKLFVKGSIEEGLMSLTDQRQGRVNEGHADYEYWRRRAARTAQRAQTIAGNLKSDRDNVRAHEFDFLFTEPKLEEASQDYKKGLDAQPVPASAPPADRQAPKAAAPVRVNRPPVVEGIRAGPGPGSGRGRGRGAGGGRGRKRKEREVSPGARIPPEEEDYDVVRSVKTRERKRVNYAEKDPELSEEEEEAGSEEEGKEKPAGRAKAAERPAAKRAREPSPAPAEKETSEDEYRAEDDSDADAEEPAYDPSASDSDGEAPRRTRGAKGGRGAGAAKRQPQAKKPRRKAAKKKEESVEIVVEDDDDIVVLDD